MINSSATCEAMLSEAVQLETRGLIAGAIEAYKRLLAHWPGLANCWFNLARLQRLDGDFHAALDSYREALERGVVQPEEVHLNRGVIYSDHLRQFEAARRELDQALILNPDYVPALVNLANLHEDLGHRDLAAAVYERLLSMVPGDPQVLARYSGLKSVSSPDDPLILRVKALLARSEIGVADRASLEFALGRLLDCCQTYDAAFENYRAANRHSRESAGASFREYDLSVAERFVDRLISAFPSQAPTKSPSGAPQPIFVCGMFRSGSTLAEQLLAGHPQVQAGGELHFLTRAVQTDLAPFPEAMAAVPPWRLQALADDYLRMLRELSPESSWIIDKRPDNFLYIGLIKRLFPAAKIVHTRRNALDNCLSIYFLHLDQSISYALDLMDVGHHYLQYERLMKHWKLLYGADIFDFDYDRLVTEPKPSIEEMLKFLRLDWDERCLTVPATGRGIRTASVWQARESLYQRSSGRSRHYERQVGPLREYLTRMRE